MKAPKWRIRTFALKTREPHDDMTVTGHVSPCGRWGLDRRDSFWSITHLPSGLHVTRSPRKLTDVKAWCDQISADLGPILTAEWAGEADQFKADLGRAVKVHGLPH